MTFLPAHSMIELPTKNCNGREAKGLLQKEQKSLGTGGTHAHCLS